MTNNQNTCNQNQLQRFIEVNGQQIPVTEKEYHEFKRPLRAEHKRKVRASRCRDEHGNRCMKSCKYCPKLRDGGDLSLEKFSEEGFDIADTVDIFELVADKLLLEQLAAALAELEPDERFLFNALFYSDRTERAYADEVGISHQAIGKRKKKVLEKLRGLLQKYLD